MAEAETRYSKLYWRFAVEFEEAFHDDAVLATWCRLLVAADIAYPQPVEVPRRVPEAVLEKLASMKLVKLLPGDRYEIRGMKAERERQRDHAKAAATARWKKPRNAPSSAPRNARRSAQTMPREIESKRENIESPPDGEDSMPSSFVGISDEIPPQSGGQARAPDPDALRLQKLAETLTQVPYAMANVYSGLGGKAVEEQLKPYGFEKVSAAWTTVAERVRAKGGKVTLRQLVLGADDVLNPVPSAKLSTEERDEEARRASDRRVARTRRYIAEMRGEAT